MPLDGNLLVARTRASAVLAAAASAVVPRGHRPTSPAALAVALAFCAAMSAAAPAAAHKAIFVVRHAEKASATDPDTPLSLGGEDHALALARLLRNAGVTHVFVSDKKRTQQTATPLVDQRGLAPPVVVPAADTAALLVALKALPADAVVLVVGHSDTIPAILAGLGVAQKVALKDDQYGRMFVVTTDHQMFELAY
jgi:phosphohistidine phosphatase SixA